ncbi:MAG: MAC/perforin domain-containing protein [Erysipelotrichaceae bacterium]|nr:MAC/perforin domain-containing protein [Erysipelotrichaceae bacterium]
MKKNIFFLSTMSLTMMIGSFRISFLDTTYSTINNELQINRKEYNATVDLNKGGKTIVGAGKGIDIVKCDYIDANSIKTESDIFDSTWLRNLYENGEISPLYYDKSYGGSGFSIQDLYSRVKASYNLDTGASAEYGSFGGGFSSGFNLSGITEYRTSLSTYYYFQKYTRESYNYALPNTDNLSLYRSHLSNSYIENLNEYFKGNLSIDSLFDTYGTHIIAKATYGGSYDVYYSARSNSYNFKLDSTSSYENKINAKCVYKGIKGSDYSNNAFELTSNYEKTCNTFTDRLYAYSKGGEGKVYATNFDDLQNKLGAWYDTIDGNETIIGINKIIPLWKMLPSSLNTTTNINKLKNDYQSYSNAYRNKISASASFIGGKTIYEEIPLGNASDTYKVTDAKLNSQKNYFSINFNTSKYYSPDLLTYKGYKTAIVSLELQMRELDDGYQDFYLYKGEDCINSYLLRSNINYEYGSGYKKSDFDLVTINFPIFNIEELCDTDNLTIRFRAHGNCSDDWEFRKAKLKIIYSMC